METFNFFHISLNTCFKLYWEKLTSSLNKHAPWNEQHLFHEYLGQILPSEAVSLYHNIYDFLWYLGLAILIQRWFKSRACPCLLAHLDWKTTNRSDCKIDSTDLSWQFSYHCKTMLWVHWHLSPCVRDIPRKVEDRNPIARFLLPGTL